MPIIYATAYESTFKHEYVIQAGFRVVNGQAQDQRADQSGPIPLYDDSLTANQEYKLKKQGNLPDSYNNEIAHGFGKDISLAFAIRQIVPKKMKIIYIGNIDKNEKVSWIGERPWSQIVRELTFYRNIQVIINSSTVMLIKHSEK